MRKVALTITFTLFLTILPGHVASAHSGRTDSSGCHNCRVGSCAGTYHCHGGGGSSDSSELAPPVTPTLLEMPASNATTEFLPDINGTYTVRIDWDRPDGGQWSVNLSKMAGVDPGPNPDTYISSFSFPNISPGRYYVNIKEGMPNGYWSAVSYWELVVPAWSPPVPSPSPNASSPLNGSSVESAEQTASDNQESDDSSFWGVTVLGLIGGAYWLGNKKRNSDNEKV